MYIEHDSNYFKNKTKKHCASPIGMYESKHDFYGAYIRVLQFSFTRSFDNNCHHFTDFSIT